MDPVSSKMPTRVHRSRPKLHNLLTVDQGSSDTLLMYTGDVRVAQTDGIVTIDLSAFVVRILSAKCSPFPALLTQIKFCLQLNQVQAHK